MPKQKEQNTSIKDFVSIMDKQIGKLKNVDPKHALKESVNKDNKDNMIKEANKNPKPKTPKTPKTPKQQITGITQCEDMTKTATCKRNATEISPLEGKPGKKQKERANISQNQETNGEHDPQEEELNTDQCIDKIQNILVETEQHKKIGNDLEHGHEHNTNPILQDLLEALRDIKKSILNLDAKLNRELNTRVKEHKEFTDIVATQHAKIKSLDTANKELKEQNRILQNNLLNTEKEMLQLKVDFIGISESPYETPDQLRNKIAEAMLPTCDGPNEDTKWETCRNIPITDCQ